MDVEVQKYANTVVIVTSENDAKLTFINRDPEIDEKFNVTGFKDRDVTRIILPLSGMIALRDAINENIEKTKQKKTENIKADKKPKTSSKK